jgi:hypothetical protein
MRSGQMSQRRAEQSMHWVLLTGLMVLGSLITVAKADDHTVHLSSEEIALARKIDNIEKLAGVTKHLLALAPFVQIASGNPADAVLTISTNDWDKIPLAIVSMNKIKSCEIKDLIIIWTDVDQNTFSSDETKAMFISIQKKAETVCSS